MSGVGLEVLLEDLIPEIAYSGEKGITISELLRLVRQYHQSVIPEQHGATLDDRSKGLQGADEPANLERSLTDAEMASARWAWDWLRSRPQILIGGNKRWNRLELSEALALPEAVTAGETEELASGEKSGARDASVSAAGRQANNRGSKKVLTTRPRIQPSEELVWQTLAHHGVDYKRVPALEWACLQGIATARAEGILQSDLRRLVNQDKRSLPKRTDLLARKGYIAKRTVVVQKMKTSRLWLIDFAPPLVEEETCGLDLSPESLTKDLEPVPWHKRWTGNNIDMDALGRTVVGVVKAWTVIRYSDLRTKMGVSGKRWQMKTLAKNCQRLVDMGVFKYTAASFPGSSRKVFKDCLKFVREPSAEEWDKFLATGKKTSQYSDPTRHREPKPNALALYGRSGDGEQKSGDSRSKLKRIFSGWAPEKPIAQSVYEVIRRAGPEGASNPQVSVATVGYQHRRYLSSYLSKVAETQQPPHLKKFQIVSKLVRTGKTSAYMFSVPAAESPPNQAGHSTSAGEGVSQEQPASIDGSSTFTGTDPYGFGAVKPKAFADAKDLSLSALSQIAKKSRSSSRRKLQAGSRLQRAADAEIASGITHQANSELTGQGDQHPATAPGQAPKRDFDEAFGNHGPAEFDLAKPNPSAETPSSSATFTSVNQANQPPSSGAADLEREDLVMAVRYNGGPGKLRLCRSDNCLSFVKGGRGGNRKPVTIPLNVNFEEVATRDAPEGNEKSLVFIIGPKDDTSPSTYIFTFDDNDAEVRDTAAAIMREVKMINAPPSTEPDQRDEQHAPQDDSVAESAPQNLGPARGRGRGRGGSRGRGRKGQRLAGGAKPWICPTCGGSWKNDLGLKYHLEKAQVPCNPNFDPASLLERSRKRRKPSPPPPTPSAHSEVGDEGTLDRSRLARNARKPQKDGARPALKIRAAMRSLPGRAQQFRGLDFAEVDVDEEPESRVLEQSRPMPRTVSLLPAGPGANAEPESVTPTLAGNIVFPAERSVTEGTKTSLDSNAPAPTLLRTIQPSQSIVHDDRPQRDTLAEDRIPRAPLPGHMESQPLTPLPTPRAAATRPTKPTKPQKADGALRAGFSSGTIPSHSAPVNEFDVRRTNGTLLPHGSRDASPTTGGSPVSGRIERSKCEYPEPPSERNVKGTWASLDSHDENTVARPFVPSSDYDLMATDAKRRTAQAFDIINYLLDNNGGVFPGDKALFYALTKVFLQEFRNQMPPTWKNCQTAVKALETRKLATMHTHMLKTERGRLQTCTLLIRSGVDPAGRIPTLMKHKMRETYPRIYIPTAFSPTQEELALLQELDKKPSSSGKDRKQNANGQKFRSKRQIDDIAVFNAPYYTQSAPVAGSKKDPLWIRESEQLRKDGSDSRKRSAADDPSSPSFQKRARTGFQEASTGPRNWGHTNQYDDDIPVDPKIMGPVPNPPSPSHGRSWLGDAYPRWEASEGFEDDISSPKRPISDARRKYRVSSVFPERDFTTWDKEPPSVVEAIRAYSLLPSIGSRRARRLSAALKPMSKLPPELGRIRNPGLSSLPASFFAIGKAGLVRPAPAEVQFLGPSTNLDDGAKDAVEDQERMQFTDSTINEDVTPDQVGVEQSHAAPGESHAASQKFRFVLPAVLNGSSSDSWSSLEPVFVEHYATSVTLDGRLPPDKYLLAQDLRSSIEEMAQKLEAEETGANFWVDKEYAKFCSLINRIAAWEQSQNVPGLLNGDLAMADHLYVNVCPPNSKTMSATPRWSEETQFDVETLPYEDLEDDTYHDYLFAGNRLGRAPRDSGQAHKKRRVHKAEVNQVRRVQGRPPKFKLQATKTMREHTAYPKTADDFLRAPGDENEELDWSSENVRLAAFVVVTTLLGGVDRVVDWGLMLRLMPDQTISQLRHYWGGLKKDRQSTIVSLADKFRRAFLEAYGNEIPPINFDDVLSYDWKGLIKWTISLDGTERRTLPSTRTALDEKFTLRKFKHGNREWREAYYHPQRSVFNRFQDATSEALAFSVDDTADRKPSLDMVVAMSWTRSLCVTPVEAYSADAVLHRRNSLYPKLSKTEITELIIKGVDQLQRQGVISKSSSKWSNGRRWRFNTRVLDSLDKVAQQEKFAKAVQFKRELDQAFRESEGEKKKRVTYITNDGMIMALLNLQASGRVNIETTGQPNVPLGHEPLNYETRKYTKKYLHFRLDIVPTESYLYDDDEELADLRRRIRDATPPTRGPGGAVPVWCDVFGKVDTDRWLKYLSAVLITLASRGSMPADELVKTLKPVIMLFEAELIMEWAEKLGLLKTQIEGTALAVMEWWWIAVEAQREGPTAPRPRKSLPSSRPSKVVEGGMS